uniref:Peptidase C39 domain-containing protein n=1 Tax=uncultured Thiotrichaceae bacterium TaxID=298394 RepID=A0A6S6TM42_9GAMM|nr:MAG: Unknown protein [uncultured Thiotrichaceae bacterium]
MKKPLAGMLPILVAIGMTGCTGQMSASKTLSWYVGQGSKLDDCGPATAAMAANWAGGKSNLRYAKAVTRDSGWWHTNDIATHLTQQGITTEQVKLRNLRALLTQGHGAIMRVTILGVPHYIFASDLNEQDRLLVADPLKGKIRMSIERLERMTIDDTVLAVRNTPEHPIEQFDINNLPWARSSRATVKMPVPVRTSMRIERHQTGHHLY